MSSLYKTLLGDLADVLFPASCAGCNRALARSEEVICTNCLTRLPRFDDSQELENRLAGRIPVAAIAGYLKYETGGLTQRLLHRLKYRGQRQIGLILGTQFGAWLQQQPFWQEVEAIIPLPLHPTKEKKRGYNQSALLAQGISDATGLPVLIDVVQRLRPSASQTRKSREERWLNVAGIFAVKDGTAMAGRHVLLVDDVLTTGATLEACGQTLLEAGAEKLSLAVLAVAM